jgi:hypothetical protein
MSRLFLSRNIEGRKRPGRFTSIVGGCNATFGRRCLGPSQRTFRQRLDAATARYAAHFTHDYDERLLCARGRVICVQHGLECTYTCGLSCQGTEGAHALLAGG